MLILVTTFGLVNFETVYSLFVEAKYNFTSRDISILLTIGASTGVLFQILIIDKAIRIFGEHRLIRISLLIAAIAFLVMLIKVNFIYLIITSSIFFAFDSLLRPTVTTLLSNNVGSDEQGFISGLNTTYTSLGNIIGPIMAGNLFDVQINLPYIMGALILLGTIFLVNEKDHFRNKMVSSK